MKNKFDISNKSKPVKKTGNRPVLDGVSVFDLIMPWKKDIKEEE